MKTNDEVLLSFEISYYKKLSYPIGVYIENCKLFLTEHGFLEEDNQIIHIETKNIEYAYPIQTNEIINKKHRLISCLEKKIFMF